MKKGLLTLTLLAALSFNPVTATTDTTQVDEIEVFSDTTSQDSSQFTVHGSPFTVDNVFDDDLDNEDFFTTSHDFSYLWEKNGEGIMGMFFVLAVLFILFVLSPIVIIGLILWFIYKNRKNRMHLAEMAMQNGQPIPDEFVSKAPLGADEVRQKGLRQVFLGIGLIFLLGWAAGKIGAGIGVLVLCIGLGNLLIARTGKNNDFPGSEIRPKGE